MEAGGPFQVTSGWLAAGIYIAQAEVCCQGSVFGMLSFIKIFLSKRKDCMQPGCRKHLFCGFWDLELRKGNGAGDVDLDGTNPETGTRAGRVSAGDQRALLSPEERAVSGAPWNSGIHLWAGKEKAAKECQRHGLYATAVCAFHS